MAKSITQPDGLPSKPKNIRGKYIEATIENGEVALNPVGFTGGTCHAATREYEQDLGVITEKRITGAACEQKVKA